MQLDAVHEGHHQIAEHDMVALPTFEPRQRRSSIADNDDFAFIRQQAIQGFAERRLIVDDENPSGASHTGGGSRRGGD